MDDAKPSLLYKVKPIGDRLPAVKRPEGHVHFRTKIMWVAVILILLIIVLALLTVLCSHSRRDEHTESKKGEVR